MNATATGWKIFDARAPILTYGYSFGPGTANALAVGVEGGLAIISPPCRRRMHFITWALPSGKCDFPRRLYSLRYELETGATATQPEREFDDRVPEVDKDARRFGSIRRWVMRIPTTHA